ncbi:MAG: bifunctional folylpolyglutamate synthase/dihydrofolate synthase, partial [Saprospiraceae bacterium]|nr:bifunctional folylpolyglutamate synthase/dihydrofolate synthase [Saprospiraceae bacterium]
MQQPSAYQQTLSFLYRQLPMFQRIGPAAFKKDLTNTLALCAALHHPERRFRSIHLAGTNGKGSTAHLLAGALQGAGYLTGLYTSPHYRDFRERIKIDGQLMPRKEVVRFVRLVEPLIEELHPSFFELTVGMAFWYFAEEQIDWAVVETGLGGRLDSTNVITPELSLITNISFDHQDFLGDTLPAIAGEKAGIIKPGV